FGLNGVEFDARRWQVLGVPAADTNLCVATRASGIHGIAEVMNPGGKPLVIGSYAPGSALWDVPMRLRAALDLNLRLVEGYDGTGRSGIPPGRRALEARRGGDLRRGGAAPDRRAAHDAGGTADAPAPDQQPRGLLIRAEAHEPVKAEWRLSSPTTRLSA